VRNIYPVILAGGTGDRLWPLSRKSYPKQFSRLVSKKSLFQDCVRRLCQSKKIHFNAHTILTAFDYRFIILEQLLELGVEAGDILLEPSSKNTAPSVLAASLLLYEKDVEATLLVAPSDHLISDSNIFHAALEDGVTKVDQGNIVLFGIEPLSAETGYGYLKVRDNESAPALDLVEFVEKPDKGLAEHMISSGEFLWNSGILLFKAEDMINAFRLKRHGLIKHVKDSIKTGFSDLEFFQLGEAYWNRCESISIDYAILENINNLVAIPLNAGWADLGSWDAVSKTLDSDKKGNVVSGNAMQFKCTNTMLRSESEAIQLVGIGLENIVAISMSDAVLVSQKNELRLMKDVVSALRKQEIPQAEIFPKDYRPWGWFETLIKKERFHVKRIKVKPGAALSLQSHKFRSEHWVVVEGVAKVTVSGRVFEISEGESAYIPAGHKHRLENCTDKSMIIIEVQNGSYLGEDDITRYEDLYSRVKQDQ
tara:strand:+ start:535 stop:1974 length:1440 start_codon:yes stop_codon:yes gene_type:complete